MIIINQTPLETVPNIVEAIVKHVKPKRSKGLVIRVYCRKDCKHFSGQTSPKPTSIPKALKVPLSNADCDAYVTIGVPLKFPGTPEQWAIEFVNVVYHEISHVWDAQMNTTRHWRFDVQWEDRPQEMIAMFYASTKMGKLPIRIKILMEQLIVELRKLK